MYSSPTSFATPQPDAFRGPRMPLPPLVPPPMGLFSPSADAGYRPPPLQGMSASPTPQPPQRPPRATKASTSGTTAGVAITANTAASKKSSRDSKRRATHSQIERRRREKINDRLITLRNLVPACLQEIEDRLRGKIEEQEAEEAARAAAAAGQASGSGATSPAGGQRAKRKRNRKKAADTTKGATTGADPELGLHKLEVLTHTIDYIYQLQSRIEELETGVAPTRVRKVQDKDDDDDDEMREDDGPEDEEEESVDVRPPAAKRRGSVAVSSSSPTKTTSRPRDQQRATTPAGASDSSGATTASPLMSPPEASPMFLANMATSRRSSGATTPSAASSLTSPFMSLSASSPIFMGGGLGANFGGSATSTAFAKLALPPAMMASSEREREPASTAPSTSHDRNPRSQQRSTHGSTSAVRGGAPQSTSSHRPPAVDDRDDKASAAELLLSFSASPEEALRPQQSGRSAANATVPSLLRRRTTLDNCSGGGSVGLPSLPAFATRLADRSQQHGGAAGPHAATGARTVPGSAPGGSVASRRAGEGLPSPPLFALDAQGGQKGSD